MFSLLITSVCRLYFQQAFGGQLGPKGEVWTTYSDISPFRFGIIFATELNETFKIGPVFANFLPMVVITDYYLSVYILPIKMLKQHQTIRRYNTLLCFSVRENA